MISPVKRSAATRTATGATSITKVPVTSPAASSVDVVVPNTTSAS